MINELVRTWKETVVAEKPNFLFDSSFLNKFPSAGETTQNIITFLQKQPIVPFANRELFRWKV